MAQELPPELLNAVMQAESRGQRYDEKGRLLTSKKGAKGEMQVMDPTNLSPGFGVAPAKDKSPEERARVGRDYLAAMVDRYPDRDTALMAYNWGPGNVDKWLKAGAPAEKIPEETRNYVSKIDKMLTKDMSAKAPAPTPDRATLEMNKAIDAGVSAQAPAPTATPAPAQTVAARTAAYGPSYQAALAVSMLGDEDEKEDKDPDEPTEAEKFLAAGAAPTAANALAKLDLSYSSPFAEPEPVVPVKMAAGGVPFRPTTSYRPSAKAELSAVKSDYDKYIADATGFNAAAQKYQTEQYDPYVAKLDAYNRAIEAWNAGSRETDFTGVAPTAPAEFTQATPVAPTKDQAYATALQQRAQKDATNRQTALNVAANPAAYGLSMPAFFADGGEVEPTAEEIAAASRPAFITPSSGIGRKEGPISEALRSGEAYTAAARGVTEMPYNIAGAPMDLAMLARQALTGQAPAGQVGTSEYIKRKATEMGIRPAPPTDPTLRGFYAAGDIGSSIVNPASIPRAAARGASAVGKTAAETLADFQQYNRQLAVPGASYAVKPKGGTFAYSPEDAELAKPVSKLAKVLRDYKIEATDLGASDEVQAFLNAKAPKYFTTTYGTADDPLRTAIAKKQIAPFGSDVQVFKPYLVESAFNPKAVGNLEARVDLERAYDAATGINVNALQPEGIPRGFESSIRQGISAKMGQEGVPLEYQNLPSTTVFPQSEFGSYPASTEMLRRLVEREGKLPTNLQQALRTGEPLYDVDPRMALLKPTNVIEALEQVPANKLKNMSFPEALIQGSQALAPVRNYLTAVDLADRGAKVPRAALDMFTSPVVEAPSVGGQWVQLDKPIATLLEGKLLKHSLGGYNAGDSYGTAYTGLPYGGKKAFDEGLVQVYSLRDEQGLPKVTLEMAKSDGGKGKTWDVSQIRGRFNSEPPKETWDDIFRLLDKIEGKDGLNRIKDNSYRMSPTGESIDGTQVRWDREYDLYKQQSEK